MKTTGTCSLALAFAVASALLLPAHGVLGDAGLNSGQHSGHGTLHQPKVAIIGAGIGGAFAAYNLRQLLNDSVEVHM